MPRPNILICFADQQRPDTIGAYGQRLPVTPELDRIAADGVRFANAYTCQPVCGPARACLQTGRWATDLGCHTNGRALPRSAKTIAHHLGDCGWQTAYVGKWHLASEEHGTERRNLRVEAVPPDLRGGWRDHWVASDVLEFTSHGYGGHMFAGDGRRVEFPDGRYRADAVTDQLLAWLEGGRDRTRPFLGMISWIEPHHQNDRDCYEGPTGSPGRWAGYAPPGDLAAFRGTGDWEANYPDYLGCCNAIDGNLGRIRACLEAQGAWDDTVVIYCADHGSHFRVREGEYKRSCHDASIHIPLIIRGPGFRGGRVEEAIASLIDIPPTVLGAAGVPAAPEMAGRDLARAGSADWPEDAFLQISESHCGRALRTSRWTYSLRAVDAGGGAATSPSATWREDFLYDNAGDPHQLVNRAADPACAAVRTDLAKRLATRMVATGDAPPMIVPAA